MATPTPPNTPHLDSDLWDLDAKMAEQPPTDAIAAQISILKESMASDQLTNKHKQSVFTSTIMVCLSGGGVDQALDILDSNSDQKIFAESPVARAQLYLAVILKLIEKGFHAKANSLHQKADAIGVWKNGPAQQASAQEKLTEVGF